MAEWSRIEHTPSRRNALYALLILCLLLGLYTGRPAFFHLTYLFTALLIVSFLWARANLSGINIQRQTHAPRTQVGETFSETFRITNTARRWNPLGHKLWIELRDGSNVPGHHASRVISDLKPGQTQAWSVQTGCYQRGAFQLGPISLVSGDPFGLFQIERAFAATSTLTVFPATVALPNLKPPMGRLSGGSNLRRRQTQSVTTNAVGLRDYRPGDSYSRIHWPSTARKGRLLVKEFELDPITDIWMILDMDATRHYPASTYGPPNVAGISLLPPYTEEYAITITASVAQHFLMRDRAIGLVWYNPKRRVIPPDRDSRQLIKVLRELATLHPRGEMPLHDALELEMPYLGRGVTVFIITASIDEQWAGTASMIKQKGAEVAAILIDPWNFGGPGEAKPLAQMLEAAGIQAHVVGRGDDLGEAVGRGTAGNYLHYFAR
jgi:uncharacterized protein (DUF58 family)